MPVINKPTEKLYYSIGEVAQEFDVNASLIRFWEKHFPEINPKKNKRGNRVYTKSDLEILRTVYHLVKERGFTLEGAKQKLSKGKKAASDDAEIVSRLKKVRSFLTDLKENL